MANNQYVNKVQFGNETLIDLTQDTINPEVMLSGYTAHNAAGAPITGGITIRNGLDLNFYWNNGQYQIGIPAGAYSAGSLGLPGIQILPPESGENTFYIDFPNNAQPSGNDWTRITFSVDANGNSNITDDTIPASGVSF